MKLASEVFRECEEALETSNSPLEYRLELELLEVELSRARGGMHRPSPRAPASLSELSPSPLQELTVDFAEDGVVLLELSREGTVAEDHSPEVSEA